MTVNDLHLDEEFTAGVVQHMNEDHSDACLIMIQALGELPTAMSAVMTSVDAQGMDFTAGLKDGSAQKVRIAFDKPASRDAQIRGFIVALTRKARATQEL